MKKSALLLSLLLLTACSTTEPVKETTITESTTTEPTSQEVSQENTYEWVEEGISFQVPEGLVVTKLDGLLVLDTELLTNYEGEGQGKISISAHEGNIEKEPITQSTKEVKISQNTFVEEIYPNEFEGGNVQHDMIQKGSIVISVYGSDNDPDLKTILNTLSF